MKMTHKWINNLCIKIRDKWYFKIVLWILIGIIRSLLILFLILTFYFYLNKKYLLSILFFLLFLIFLIIDRKLFLQRKDIIIIDIDILLKGIKDNKEKIIIKIKKDLIPAIKDHANYDINRRSNTYDDLTKLKNYLDYFIIYLDFTKEDNIKLLEEFLKNIKDIFNNERYSSIIYTINSNFDKIKKSEDFKVISNNLKSQDIDIESSNIYLILRNIEDKTIIKYQKFIINVLYYINKYYKAVLIILFLILIIFFRNYIDKINSLLTILLRA